MKQTIENSRSDPEQSIESFGCSLEQVMDDKIKKLYRQLWIIGTGIVLTNVSLVAIIMVLLG